jgi:antitoxin component YwqK of YwqJK toxin-antitoxin module
MKRKLLKNSLKLNSKALTVSVIFVILSIYLLMISVSISNNFYFLSIPVMFITLYLGKLTFEQIGDEYKRYINDEKYFNDGYHKSYFKDNVNQVQFEINIIDGKREGLYAEYHKSGAVKIKRNYKKGELHGSHVEYHENRTIRHKTNYKNDIQFGKTLSFYKNGNIFREFNLVNGKYEGEIREYFNNGNLKFLINGNKHAFYNSENKLVCDIELTGTLSSRQTEFTGKWRNYRKDGSIEYQLDFDDTDSNQEEKTVVKTIYTKVGDLYNKAVIGFKTIDNSDVNFLNKYGRERMESKSIEVKPEYIIKGPPGVYTGNKIIDLKPITSIEDILILKSL